MNQKTRGSFGYCVNKLLWGSWYSIQMNVTEKLIFHIQYFFWKILPCILQTLLFVKYIIL